MAGFAKQATDTNFEADVLGSDKPVLVDFWAEWCGPCRMIAPSVEAIAEEYKEKAGVYKMNVDENPHTPSKYGVRGIPMLIIFKNGEVSSTKVGSLPEAQIESWITENI